MDSVHLAEKLGYEYDHEYTAYEVSGEEGTHGYELQGYINKRFKPTDEINRQYPPDEWFVEAGHPPVKAWYKIQDMAYEKGLIRETAIGNCKVMFFDIWSVRCMKMSESVIHTGYGD